MTGATPSKSAVYLYAITDQHDAALPPGGGLDGAPLATVLHRRLAAVVSAQDPGAVKPTERALWQHESVCEALMEGGAVLPARFGAMFSDEEQLRGELARRYEEFVRTLERVSGCVELGVRVVGRTRPPSAGPNPSETARPGTVYLRGRLDERREVEALADAVHERLAPLSSATSTRVAATGGLVLTGAYLVGRDQIAEFRRRVQRLEHERPDVSILCTGPWPPYSFVDDPGAA